MCSAPTSTPEEALAAVSEREAALRKFYSDKRILVHWMDTAGLFRKEMCGAAVTAVSSASSSSHISSSAQNEKPCATAEEEGIADFAKDVAGVFGASLIPAEVLLTGHHCTPFSVLFASLLSAARATSDTKPKTANNLPLVLEAFDPDRSPPFILKRSNGGVSPFKQPCALRQQTARGKAAKLDATCRWCGAENPGGGCNVSRATDDDWHEVIAKQPESKKWCSSCRQRFSARNDVALRLRLAPMALSTSMSGPGCDGGAGHSQPQHGAGNGEAMPAVADPLGAGAFSANQSGQSTSVLVRGVLKAVVQPGELRRDGAFWCQDVEGHGDLELVSPAGLPSSWRGLTAVSVQSSCCDPQP